MVSKSNRIVYNMSNMLYGFTIVFKFISMQLEWNSILNISLSEELESSYSKRHPDPLKDHGYTRAPYSSPSKSPYDTRAGGELSSSTDRYKTDAYRCVVG